MSESNPDKMVGTVIQNRRLELGISQGELAATLRGLGTNWSQGTLSRVELGERPVRLVEAAVVAKALGIEIGQLLQAEQSPEERLLAGHAEVIERVREMFDWTTSIYGKVDDVRELLETVPHLCSILDQSESGGPKNPADYRAWVARLVASLDFGSRGSPYPTETRAEALELMAIPRAAISRSTAVSVGPGDDDWEIVP
jgi:transcriptional regulator with XRE-family HTH domain